MSRKVCGKSFKDAKNYPKSQSCGYEPDSVQHKRGIRDLRKPTAKPYEIPRRKSSQFFCFGEVGTAPYPEALRRGSCLPSRG